MAYYTLGNRIQQYIILINIIHPKDNLNKFCLDAKAELLLITSFLINLQ